MGDYSRNRTGYLASSAMELCWLHSWVLFLLVTIFGYPASILFSALLYLGGAITTRFMHLKKRLVIQVVLVHALVFLVLIEAAVRYFVYLPGAKPEKIGFYRLIESDKGIMEWLLVGILLLLAILIYWRSTVSISKPFVGSTMYNRFDLGVAAFVVLLLIESFMSVRGGIPVKTRPLEYQFIPFFLFGLLAIGYTKISAGKERHFSQRFYRIGIALGVAVVVLVSGVGMVLLFNAQMLTTAESLSVVLRNIGSPIGRALVVVLRLIWGRKRAVDRGADQGGDSQMGAMKIPEQKDESGLLQEIAIWFLAAVAIIMVLVVLVLLIRLLLRLLFRNSQAPVRTFSWSFDFLGWIRNFIAAFRVFLTTSVSLLRAPDNAVEAYTRLKRWGRRSGKPLLRSETPREYSHRLSARFPALEKEFAALVDVINQEVYATRDLDEMQIQTTWSILRNLSHPVHWPGRLKSWLLSGAGK